MVSKDGLVQGYGLERSVIMIWFDRRQSERGEKERKINEKWTSNRSNSDVAAKVLKTLWTIFRSFYNGWDGFVVRWRAGGPRKMAWCIARKDLRAVSGIVANAFGYGEAGESAMEWVSCIDIHSGEPCRLSFAQLPLKAMPATLPYQADYNLVLTAFSSLSCQRSFPFIRYGCAPCILRYMALWNCMHCR